MPGFDKGVKMQSEVPLTTNSRRSHSGPGFWSSIGVAAVLLAGCAQSAAAPSASVSSAQSPATKPSSAPAQSAAAKPSGSPAQSAAAKPPASAGQSSASQPLVKLKTAINGTSASTNFLWVMHDAGIFEKHGLSVDLEPMTGAASAGALVGGDIQFVIHSGPQLILSAFAAGSPLKIIGAMEDTYDEILVTPTSINSVGDLRGKNVGGASLSSANTAAALKLLKENGMEPGRDFKLIQTGSSASEAGIAAQLISHQIDAGALTTDFADKLVAQGGFHILVDFPQTDIHVASQVIAFQSSYIEQHPDVAQRLIDALIEGVRYFKDNKDAAVAGFRTHYKMEDQQAMEKLWERQSQLLSKAPTTTKDDYADLIAQMPADAPKLSDEKMDMLLDLRFVDDAVKRGLASY
jgi:NitT/TauT family transport system substrate-binding protein